LITGASSGLGVEFATRFAERGADVVLAARRLPRLEQLADHLRRTYGVAAEPVAADLSVPQAGALLRDELRSRGITVSTLINNAGTAVTGPFAQAAADQLAKQIAVNVTATVELTHTFLPDLLGAADGALVNLASLTAYQPVPQLAVYAAAKAFVLHFTEALSYELRDSPLTVLALAPGPTMTEFYDVSGTDTTGVRLQTPQEVVATALQALDARRTPPSVISGFANRMTVVAGKMVSRRTVLSIAGRSVRPSASRRP
jgi:hypothetical protein